MQSPLSALPCPESIESLFPRTLVRVDALLRVVGLSWLVGCREDDGPISSPGPGLAALARHQPVASATRKGQRNASQGSQDSQDKPPPNYHGACARARTAPASALQPTKGCTRETPTRIRRGSHLRPGGGDPRPRTHTNVQFWVCSTMTLLCPLPRCLSLLSQVRAHDVPGSGMGFMPSCGTTVVIPIPIPIPRCSKGLTCCAEALSSHGSFARPPFRSHFRI